MKKLHFYTSYDRPPACYTTPVGESMTHQECIEDTQIENVVRRCIIDVRTPIYGDFSTMPTTLDEAIKVLDEGKRVKDELEKLQEKGNDTDKSGEDTTNSVDSAAVVQEAVDGSGGSK